MKRRDGKISATGDSRTSLTLWLVDLDASAAQLTELDAALGLLPKAATPASGPPYDRRRLAAQISLRAILAGKIGVEAARQPFEIGIAGKPSLRRPPSRQGEAGALPTRRPHFSLSHCDGFALIAISDDAEVGVDIEALRPIRISDHRRADLEAAAQALAPDHTLPVGPAELRTMQAWVRLEALAKATGEGISALFGRLGVRGQLGPLPGADSASVRIIVRDVDPRQGGKLLAAVASADERLSRQDGLPAVCQLDTSPSGLAALVGEG